MSVPMVDTPRREHQDSLFVDPFPLQIFLVGFSQNMKHKLLKNSSQTFFWIGSSEFLTAGKGLGEGSSFSWTSERFLFKFFFTLTIFIQILKTRVGTSNVCCGKT